MYAVNREPQINVTKLPKPRKSIVAKANCYKKASLSTLL